MIRKYDITKEELLEKLENARYDIRMLDMESVQLPNFSVAYGGKLLKLGSVHGYHIWHIRSGLVMIGYSSSGNASGYKLRKMDGHDLQKFKEASEHLEQMGESAHFISEEMTKKAYEFVFEKCRLKMLFMEGKGAFG